METTTEGRQGVSTRGWPMLSGAGHAAVSWPAARPGPPQHLAMALRASGDQRVGETMGAGAGAGARGGDAEPTSQAPGWGPRYWG
eukprot:11002769-Alexandrium_andersonii.AAC.2